MIELIILDGSTIPVPLTNPEYVLSQQELQRYETLRSDRRRREFLLGRILLKAALTDTDHHRGRDFTTINPAISVTGKPTLAGVEFNLSHTGDVVLLAMGDQPVGVDVESVQNFDAMMLELCFTGKERQYISCSREPDRTATLLWCQKEAAAKATGVGLLSELEETRKQALYFSSGILSIAGQPRAYAVCSPRPILQADVVPALPRFQRVFATYDQKAAAAGVVQQCRQPRESATNSLP